MQVMSQAVPRANSTFAIFTATNLCPTTRKIPARKTGYPGSRTMVNAVSGYIRYPCPSARLVASWSYPSAYSSWLYIGCRRALTSGSTTKSIQAWKTMTRTTRLLSANSEGRLMCRRIIAHPEKGDAEVPGSVVGGSAWCSCDCPSSDLAPRTPRRCDSGTAARGCESREAYPERTKQGHRDTRLGNAGICAGPGTAVPNGAATSHDRWQPPTVACRSRRRTRL